MKKQESKGPRKIEGVAGESMKKYGRNLARAMYQSKGSGLPPKQGGRGR
jgi:hypothetical protein